MRKNAVHGNRMTNIGTIERFMRVALGGAVALWALSRFFGGGGGPTQVMLDFAIFALGVDFVVTGVRGHCPLYKWLGRSTARRQRAL